MYRLAYVAGGFLALLGIVSLAVSGSSSLDRLASRPATPASVADGLDRTHKGDRLADSSGKPPQKRSHGFTEPDQRRSERHQQQMLDHVHGQQVRVA